MRDRHGSIEESEFTTNISGLTMWNSKKVIVIIVFGYKRAVEREAKKFKLKSVFCTCDLPLILHL